MLSDILSQKVIYFHVNSKYLNIYIAKRQNIQCVPIDTIHEHQISYCKSQNLNQKKIFILYYIFFTLLPFLF